MTISKLIEFLTDELKSHGMVGNFSLGLDQFGRNVIQSASIVKVIA
jgi:hypothetical protein